MKTQQSLMYALLAVIFLTSSCRSAGFVRPDPKIKQKALDNDSSSPVPNLERLFEKEVIEAIYKRFRDPSVNPILIPQLSIPIEMQQGFNISANFSMRNTSVIGLSGLVIDKLKIQLLPPSVNFAVTLPSIVVKGDYNLDGHSSFKPVISGNGPFEVSVEGIKVGAAIKLSLLNRVSINSLKLTLGLGGIHVNFEHLMNDDVLSNFINDLINLNALPMFEKYKEKIQLEVAEQVIAVINPVLSDLSLQEIIDIILGGGQ